MKTILILRHAKSDWGNPALADFDRPLNKRGLNDAPRIGKLLKAYQQVPDQILASPAKRAKQTIELVAENCGYSKNSIQWMDGFYGADRYDLLTALKQLPNHINRAMLVGHNPTMEETVALLCQGPRADDSFIRMPTAALVCLTVHVDQWTTLKPGFATLQWFIIPKLIKSIMS